MMFISASRQNSSLPPYDLFIVRAGTSHIDIRPRDDGQHTRLEKQMIHRISRLRGGNTSKQCTPHSTCSSGGSHILTSHCMLGSHERAHKELKKLLKSLYVLDRAVGLMGEEIRTLKVLQLGLCGMSLFNDFIVVSSSRLSFTEPVELFKIP